MLAGVDEIVIVVVSQTAAGAEQHQQCEEKQ